MREEISMGLFSRLFSSLKFKPDFSKTEYDNWLVFLDKGGTSEEWESLKKKNSWHFKDVPLKYIRNMKKKYDRFRQIF